jgi:hypothetical protein
LNREEITALIHKTIYSTADLNSQIPDVDQMANHLFDTLKPTDVERELFVTLFLERMGQEQILQKSIYDGVTDFLNYMLASFEANAQNTVLCSWTQGNVFLQTRKAQVFQEQVSNKAFLAKPSIYASLEKIGLLSTTYQDLRDQNCDLICLLDDRLANVLAARKLIGAANMLYIHKIRPDKTVTHRLQEEDQNLFECKEWSEVEKVIKGKDFKKLGLILDKDGVIFNSTVYRKLLEESLVEFAESLMARV